MKVSAVFALASLAGVLAIAPAAGHNCGFGRACQRNDRYYDDRPCCGHNGGDCANWHHQSCARLSSQFVMAEGKISEINYLPASDPDSSVLELRLNTGAAAVLVRLGPSWFFKRNSFQVKEGDALSVHGYRVSGAEGEVFVATEIERSGQRLVLRDDWGRPAWW